MKLRFIALLFLAQIVPAIAQEEINTTKAVDTIALKTVAVEAVDDSAATEETSRLTPEQILAIQKTTLQNQKEAERIKAEAEAAAKAVEKDQRKLEKE
ncbi:hypothetical protein [Flavobacterium wongokense]|uniref:hypothetical protein n=1 Tax=Flavobacterium wongokense TaxID=2910674 RepID=UPI001F2016B0|nr:hypothetical protein [Flavobacterium sp. WG47]MCF6130995.1 hypothetical protein [Flavobacterium sp. WG47]